jgi:long-chain fatty acid transport protein
MKTYHLLPAFCGLLFGGLYAFSAFATNGYMITGTGYKLGTAGTGVALATDGTDSVLNPALLADQPDHFIGALGVFHPDRTMDTSTAPIGNPATAGGVHSKLKNFFDGSVGYRKGIDHKTSFGISLTGLGAMVTKYPHSRTNPIVQRDPVSDTGVFYRIGFITPAVAFKADPKTNIGLGLMIGYSDFKTDSIVPPQDQNPLFPQTAGMNKRDRAWGVGLRFGTKTNVNNKLSFGFAASTPVWFERFDKYKDVLISHFDFPANATIGVDYKITPATHLLADYKFIYYRGTKLLRKGPAEGGFGWKNQSVFMIGAQHDFDKRWTGRAGYNYGKSPIANNKVFANVIAPAVIEQHFAVGMTYKAPSNYEISLNGFFAPRHQQTESGTGDFYSQAGQGTKISMWQYALQASYKVKF